METHQPQVSICLPVRNTERFVRQALESILEQSFQDFEVVVVDDASTDNTPAAIRSFADPRIHVFRLRHQGGIAATHNACLKHARGTYIAFLDADDVWLRNHLEEKVRCLGANSNIGMVYSNGFDIDSQGRITTPFTETFFNQDTVLPPGCLTKLLITRGNPIPTSSVLLRKSLYEHIGGFNSQLPWTHDWDFWARASLEGSVAYLNQQTVGLRWHEANFSRKYARTRSDLLAAGIEEMWATHMRLFNRYQSRLLLTSNDFNYIQLRMYREARHRMIQHAKEGRIREAITCGYIAFTIAKPKRLSRRESLSLV